MTDDERNKMAAVRQKFVEYFTPRKNQVFERHQFWRLQQQQGEGIDAFVTSLRLRARSYEFAELTDSLIRDKVVLSCPDARLQERLLCESDLSLTKVQTLHQAFRQSPPSLRQRKYIRIVATAVISTRISLVQPMGRCAATVVSSTTLHPVAAAGRKMAIQILSLTTRAKSRSILTNAVRVEVMKRQVQPVYTQ